MELLTSAVAASELPSERHDAARSIEIEIEAGSGARQARILETLDETGWTRRTRSTRCVSSSPRTVHASRR